MSIISPELIQGLQFYLSAPSPCPYVDGRMEQKLFVRLDADERDANVGINAFLCSAGFRRSHEVVYRPACPSCDKCVPVRIPVASFALTRSMRRIDARNRDLVLDVCVPEVTAELFGLFSSYQQARHGDSEMALMTESDFSDMLQKGRVRTELYCLRDKKGALRGCMIADDVGEGLSAVYSFFAPEDPRRSLGTALILRLIEQAGKKGKAFVYLGYWILESPKMAYKARFQPLHRLGSKGWQVVEPRVRT